MLDPRDRRILDLLQRDADAPLAEIADAVALSVSATSRRIQRLTEEGYIARRTAVLDRRKMGLPTTLFVLVKTGRHDGEWLDVFRATVTAIPEIVEVHRLTGTIDYILKVVLPDVEHYDTVYKRLVQKLSLFEVSAFISMETLKAESALPTGFA